VLVAVATLVGCGTKCGQPGIVGSYELRAGEDQYELELAGDGTGELLRNRVHVGSLKWEIEPATAQVFLNASSDLLEVMTKLAARGPPPSDAAKTRAGYFGVTPECRSSGSANRLNLDVDGQRYFLRTR
jgi:hypothetical protein